MIRFPQKCGMVRFARKGTDVEQTIILTILCSGAYFGTFAAVAKFGFPTPGCAVRNFTSVPCPGCGGTRALLKLVEGDISGAFLLNPLAIILAIGAAVLLAYCAGVLLGLWKPLRGGGASPWTRAVLLAMLCALLFTNWIYLIATLPQN